MDYNDAAAGAGLMAFLGVYSLFLLALVAIIFVSFWKIFEKAGRPGWAGIIPIYNIFVLIQIVRKPTWWAIAIVAGFFLFWIPILGWIAYLGSIVLLIIAYHRLSLAFGKDAAWTVGLVLLGIVFFPLLAFGDATYDANRISDDTGAAPVPPAV